MYRQEKLCTRAGGFGKNWDRLRTNLTFAESASVYDVSGLDACCMCGGGKQTLQTIIDETTGGSKSDNDLDAEGEMLSYAVMGVAILLGLCTVTFGFIYRSRVIQNRQVALSREQEKNRKAIALSREQEKSHKEQLEQLEQLEQPTAESHMTAVQEVTDGANASSIPVAGGILDTRIAVIDSSIMDQHQPPVTKSVASIPDRVIGDVVGLVAAGLVDAPKPHADPYADEYTNVCESIANWESKGSEVGEVIVSAAGAQSCESPCTVSSSGEQKLGKYASKLASSIATNTTAESVSEVDYSGPTFAGYFDQRAATMALASRVTGGKPVVTETDLTTGAAVAEQDRSATLDEL